jgi:hypothetical protein
VKFGGSLASAAHSVRASVEDILDIDPHSESQALAVESTMRQRHTTRPLAARRSFEAHA